MDPLGAERLHLLIEAMRVAFADTQWYVADPAFNPLPLDALAVQAYAGERRKLIDPSKATLDTQRGSPVAGSDTVYLTAVDGAGNACSFINSNYMGFGTGIVPEGTGFSSAESRPLASASTRRTRTRSRRASARITRSSRRMATRRRPMARCMRRSA